MLVHRQQLLAPAGCQGCSKRLQSSPSHRRASSRDLHNRSSKRIAVHAVAGSDSPIPQWQAVSFWGRRNGICCEKLQLWDFNGLRGMRAKEEIANGETIVRLPASSTIHIRPFQAAPTIFQAELDVWSRCSWDVKLALSLLVHKLQGKFATYVNQLPSKVLLPLTWNHTDVEKLHNPWAVKEVGKQRLKMQKAMASASPLLQRLGANEADFVWAYCLVQSRSYGGPYFITRTPQKLIIIALLEVLTVTLSRGHVMASFDASLLGMSLLLLLLVGELILAQSLQQHTLCPVIDLLNHDSNSQSYCTLDFFTNQFKVVTDRAYQPGQQVVMSYGQLSNDTLLLRYGFVEPNNPNDHYVLSSLPTTMKAYGLNLTPVDEERLAAVCVNPQGVSPTVLDWVAEAVATAKPTSPFKQLLPPSEKVRATCCRLVAAACQSELEDAPTSLEQDEALLAKCACPEERVILQYRVEKKKILTKGLSIMEQKA